MSVLRFDNVSKQYPGGHVALADVSFEVKAGEMLFVTGHSGAGKSTLLKLIHLSERPSRGAVLFGERNLMKVRGRRVALHRRDVGVVFQDHRLLTDRSVYENNAMPRPATSIRPCPPRSWPCSHRCPSAAPACWSPATTSAWSSA